MELYRSKKENNQNLPKEISPEELYDQLVNKKKTFKEIYNLNDDHIEEVYSMAEHYYQHGRYAEAVQIFSTLAKIDSNNYKIALGYASSLHQLHQFPQAILAFLRAFELNPEDPQPVFFLAEGLYHLKEWEAAEEQYAVFIELAAEKKEWKNLITKAQLVLKGLKGREESNA